MDEEDIKIATVKQSLDELHDKVTDDLKEKVEQIEHTRCEIQGVLEEVRSNIASSSKE